jgi:hypothetical protein
MSNFSFSASNVRWRQALPCWNPIFLIVSYLVADCSFYEESHKTEEERKSTSTGS